MPTLNWIGKEKVIDHDLEVKYHVLHKKYTYNAEESENMIIHGDNLLALKSLLPKYEGRIDCIYIDPPYNTGNENWIYNDNVNEPHIKSWLGKVVGGEDDDLSRHDKWLCMMYPRLKLIKKLMSKKAMIFVSIDDNELFSLKMILDEIFGSNNYLGCLPRVTKKSGKNQQIAFANNHDFILCYSRNITFVEFIKKDVDDLDYPFKDEYYDERGGYKLNQTLDYETLGYVNSLDYPIFIDGVTYYAGDVTETVYKERKRTNPLEGYRWRWSLSKFEFGLKNGFIVVKKSKNGSRIYTKTYFKASIEKNNDNYYIKYIDRKKSPSTLQFTDNIYSNDNSKKDLDSFNFNEKFNYSKPVSLIKDIICLSSPNSIVLDCFAGSGTTAQAVLELNSEDGGKRKFIEIEMMDYAETITAERIKRLITGYKNNPKYNSNFSFYELGEQLFIDDKINPDVDINELRDYIFYSSAKEPVDRNAKYKNKYMLGIKENTSYYFYYEKDKKCVLDYDFLSTIDIKSDAYIIFADACTISQQELDEYHITFKKTPRDITRF